MTLCKFVHAAGPQYDALAARLEKALEGVPELVEEVTGLPLPQDPPPLVLLAGHKQWRKAAMVHDEELVKRETRALRLTPHDIVKAWRGVSARRKRTHARWITISGMLLGDRAGRPQVVAIADTLHHTGATDAKLVRLVSHELVHVAQHHASGGQVIDYANSWVDRCRPADPTGAPLDFHRLTEGHAMWADKQITAALGHTGDFEGTYTELGRRERERWADGEQKAWLAKYDSGHAFVRRVIEALGRESFNQVWSDLHLCPTGLEVDAPDTYLARLDHHTTRNAPVPPHMGPAALPDLGAMVHQASLPEASHQALKQR